MKVELIEHTGNPEETVAKAARLCYSDKPTGDIEIKDVGKFVSKLVELGHYSPFEHASFTFAIDGISRCCSHQLVRHRIASYCVSGDTEIPSFSNVKGVTGKARTIKKMYEWQQRGLQYNGELLLRSMDDTHTIVPNKVVNVFYNGVKPVYEVTTESGRKIKTTDTHEFFTGSEWKQLKDIKVGDYVMANGIELLANEHWLRYNYLSLNRTRQELAKLIGCCEATLHKAFKKFGIVKPHSMYPNRVAGYGVKGSITETGRKALSRRMSGAGNPQYKHNREYLTVSGGYNESHKKYDKADKKCEFCGSDKFVEIHHIDKNPRHNEESNIKFLCSKCHKLWHKHRSIGTFLDKVVSIEYVGEEDVYDLEMAEPYHNYVANGFVVHNCQRSQRYVSEDSFDYIVPESLIGCKDKYEKFMAYTADLYKWLVLNGVPKEDARYILPNATATNIIVTMNARSLLNFFRLRCCNRAQWEIRELADAMYMECMKVAPLLFANAGPACVTGKCTEGKMTCGKPRINDIFGVNGNV